MPLFQSIVDTLANTFHQKEQKIEQVLENEKYNENRCYLGTSGVGMITLAKQHLADHACLHCYTDIIEALSSGIDFSQYNLDPFSYKAEWREDTIYCITIIVKDYLRIDVILLTPEESELPTTSVTHHYLTPDHSAFTLNNNILW